MGNSSDQRQDFIITDDNVVEATDVEPMVMRSLPEICRESAKNFKLKDKYEKIKKRDKTLGVKKRVFGDMVDVIVAVRFMNLLSP